MLCLVTFHGITGFARRRVITWNVLIIDLVITQNVNGVLNLVITRSVCFLNNCYNQGCRKESQSRTLL